MNLERRASKVKALGFGSIGRSFSRHRKGSNTPSCTSDEESSPGSVEDGSPVVHSSQRSKEIRYRRGLVSASTVSPKKRSRVTLYEINKEESEKAIKPSPSFQKPENVWKHKEFETSNHRNYEKEETEAPLGLVSSLLCQLEDPYRQSITRRKRSNSEPFIYSWDYGNINVDIQGVPGIDSVHCYLQQKWKEGEKTPTSLTQLTKKIQDKTKRDEQNGLVIREEPLEILAGSLPQLVNALANHDTADKAYIDIFLATHVSFMPSVDLLSILIDRFQNPSVSVGIEMSEEEKSRYENMIRVRLLNVFKKWLSAYHYDFEEGPLYQKMGGMIRELLDESIATQEQIEWGGFLKRSWNVSKLRTDSVDADEVPQPVLKKITTIPVENLSFLDFDCLELARQVALIHQALCNSIRPIHLVEWSKGKESESSPIHKLNVFSSQLQGWVVTQLMSHEVRKKRITVLTRLIKFCHKLLELNDFNGATDVYVGLSGYTSQKLWLTWKGLDKDTQHKWRQLDELMCPVGSFAALRNRMKNSKAPYTIPPALFIRDLVTINENDDHWDEEHTMVNFHKRRLLASVIFQFQESTREPYALQEVPKIQEYLKNLQILPVEQLEARATELDPKVKPKVKK